MSEKAIGFLQFRLAILLTRLAQDDFAWPSKEGLEIASLTEQISLAEKKQAQLQKATQKTFAIVTDLAEVETQIERLGAAKNQAEQFLVSADDLAG